jgi:hypothetical protein
MSEQSAYQIKLTRKGGVGPNTNWHWIIQDAAGKVVKTGSAVGEEHWKPPASSLRSAGPSSPGTGLT